ncbi:hypothetical protein CKAH01_16859 [Colletotrichum kahawae]|uniref:Uncharacterized protein n=1 Tax=Colletotrichum kahawae TaxID=34407 RepID=A0AAD9YCE4_COLKA|nr:hypothetical protein CKAH01_16859 [Colletotrichum kahawae]
MSTAATASSSTGNAYALLNATRLRISTQIATALLIAIPPNPTIDDLLTIVVGSKRYVLEAQLSYKRGRGRSSWIRDYSDFLVEVIQGRVAGSYWSCRRCDAKGQPRVFGAAATSASQEHLLRYINLRISPYLDEDSDGTPTSLSTAASTPPSLKRLRLGHTNVPKAKVTTLRDLCVASIVSADLPFAYFENSYLHLLAFRQDRGDHSGAALAATLTDVVDRYRIRD